MPRARHTGALFLALFAACNCSPTPVPAGTVTLEPSFEIPSICGEITLVAHKDAGGRPFLFVAAKEGGLRVYELGDAPKLVATIPIADLGSLHVMNLSESGSRLFLALGNTFGSDLQAPGFAIVDVQTPDKPAVVGLWKDGAITGGTGAVVSDGNTAWLGAMGHGVISFDLADPTHPAELSRFAPATDFPDAKPDAKKINARGLTLSGNTLFVSYDAGGLRILDVTDRAHPKEAGRWSNPALNGMARAYNNVALDGSLAYVGFDYCGVEVLDVADPASVKSVAWWNPWHCDESSLNWFSSDGYANEVALDKAQHLLFVSTGRSDLEVLDVADPVNPIWAAEFGGVDNGIGTWGVSVAESTAFLTYTCAVVPFYSDWTGVKAITYRR